MSNMTRTGAIRMWLTVILTAMLMGGIAVTAADDVIIEGDGIAGISVGISTEEDVITRFGKPPKTESHKTYSTELIYPKLGMSFYYCQADPRKEIFVIELKKPFNGATTKGIRIGESTWSDVLREYRNVENDDPKADDIDNEPTNDPEDGNDIELEGIGFRFKNTVRNMPDGSRSAAYVVSEIDIIERDGLRQCDSKFGTRTNDQ
ncbi:MAG: hypothetical protein JNK51_07545 [Blastocatellia bacterium]|nr:hypothetical protein [Chloracidobacterium sp.]MBL8184764.1 hypothetical protein [Blastocatellia bacterium]HRJ87473.1 hypothetical protein [Pyrinomonadaceae bacterium]HRK49792.1 hypothetical protein [Pyrinomonadaceae bacterium]